MARPARRAGEASPGDASQLGVKGRKTGVTLRDTGERDHLKMAPLNKLFSSSDEDPTPRAPSKSAAPVPHRQPTPKATPDRGGNEYGSDEMDIASSAGPGPGTVLRNRASFALPKSRSPVKAAGTSGLLSSPAKRMPNLASTGIFSRTAMPSPARQLFDEPRVSDGPPRRQVSFGQIPGGGGDDSNIIMDGGENFSADLDDMVNTAHDLVHLQMATDPIDPNLFSTNGLGSEKSPAVSLSARAKGKQREVPRKSPAQPSPPPLPFSNPGLEPESEQESGLYVHDEPEPTFSPQRVSAPAPPPAPAPAPAPEPSSSPSAPIRNLSLAKSPSRPTAQKRPSPSGPTTAASRRLRDGEKERHGDSAKRHRQTESVVSRRSEPPAKRGRGRPPKNGTVKRARGRPRQSEVESDGEEGESLMALQRGPPMPKSRGLVSMKRDSALRADDGSRGRLRNETDWWATFEDGKSAYEPGLLQDQRLNGRAGISNGHGQHGRGAAMVDEQELEDWEVDPGNVTGEIVLWEAEHETNPPGPDDAVQVTDERVAIAANAIQTYAIRDSEARYAKPLTMPFLGAGLVDLPPGSEKRPKNSRKMHLVFFVHYGKVTVSINEVQFRISAGGMWFVPRGNYYNIANDDEVVPARVYFAQGCEVVAGGGGEEEMTRRMDDVDTREVVME